MTLLVAFEVAAVLANGTYEAPVQIWDAGKGPWVDTVLQAGSVDVHTGRDLNLTTPVHISAKRMNNRAESSHVPVRRREWKLQGFKSPGSAQRFLSMHAATYNTFTIPRHLTSARTHRLFRAEAFSVWRNAAGVAA